jgi:NTE family protein
MIVRMKNTYKPKIGLALSGGGIRGLTHIGVIKALISNGIKIDFISGTSAGAVVAALFACGYTPYQMEELAKNINTIDLIDLRITVSDLFKYGIKSFMGNNSRFWSTIPNGIVKGDRIERYFKTLWKDRTVNETIIPLSITAVDLNTADTIFFTTPFKKKYSIKNTRYYHNVTLTEAVRSSISIPGVFHPKKYQDMSLVDGAVKNNLPTDILHYMGADIIIAVDLGYSGQFVSNLHSVGEILMQCIDIMNREVTLLKSEKYANIIIRPELFDINYKDIKKAMEAVIRGEEATKNQIPEIIDLVCNYSI